MKSLSFRLVLTSLAVLAAIFGVGLALMVAQVGATIDAQSSQLQAESTRNAVMTAQRRFDEGSFAAKGMIDSVIALRTAGVADRAVYDAVLRNALAENPELIGTWTGWEPNALDGKDSQFVNTAGTDASGRYVPYWNRGSGEIKLEPLLDYDKPGPGDYYQLPKSLKRPVAIEPYVYAVAGKDVLMMSFGIPIMVNGTYMGTGGADMALADLGTAISAIRPFDTGHVELVSQAGIMAASPNADEVGKPIAADNPVLVVAKKALDSDKMEITSVVDHGVEVQAMAAPFKVGATGDRWVAVSMVPMATLTAAVTNGRLTVLGIGIASLLVFATLLYFLVRQLVTRPLKSQMEVMHALAGGDNAVDVPGLQRKDEIGLIAKSVQVFKDAALDKVRIEAEAAANRSEAEKSRKASEDLQAAAEAEKRVAAQRTAKAVTALANGLAGLARGDLTVAITEPFDGGSDEIRLQFNQAVGKFAEIMTQLKDTSTALKTATGEILSGANDLAERTTKQAAAIEETTAAIEQLSNTVNENAKRADNASQMSRAVSATAEQTGAVMEQSNAAMERISSSSSKISNIIGMIDDIAFQTNLLALNASVEAARAGDAGNGFAVVAIEVRRLAQSAAGASSQVKVLIEQSATEVAAGSKLVADATQKLTAMVSSVKESAGLIQDIAAASQEQASAISQVSTAIRQMDEMTQHNAALVEETNAAIEQTENQANDLDHIVDQFVVSGGSRAAIRTAPPKAVAAPAKAPAKGGIKALQEKVTSAAKSYLSRGNTAVKDEEWSEF